MKKVCIYTLGCKVNQYESSAIAEKLKHQGFEVSENLTEADFYIINSCAVTNEAERKSRASVAKCLSHNPLAKVFVIGCASEKNNDQFFEKDNVVYVNGTFDKMGVVSLIEQDVSHNTCQNEIYEDYEIYDHKGDKRTRAFIKVQDGCNNFCAYCIVPYLRGRSRSRKIEDVLKEVKNLKKTKEIVLTGINLSDYKFGGLINLAEKVDEVGIRFRFGSLEVSVIDDDFLLRLKKLKNFCPQFHLSLQSGSTKVLADMNRKYTAEEYIKTCDKIYKTFDLASITTDVIVGYPTETYENFLESCDLAKRVGFLDMHVFPFSKRSGTKAESLKDLPKRDKAERVEILTNIKEELRGKFIENIKGKTFEILIEEKVGDFYIGHTENFIKAYLKGKGLKINKIVKGKLKSAFKDGGEFEVVK